MFFAFIEVDKKKFHQHPQYYRSQSSLCTWKECLSKANHLFTSFTFATITVEQYDVILSVIISKDLNKPLRLGKIKTSKRVNSDFYPKAKPARVERSPALGP